MFPAQGTRPLFSSLHAILGTGLAKATLWALQQGAAAGDAVVLTADGRQLHARWRDRVAPISAPFEISRLRQRANADWHALVDELLAHGQVTPARFATLVDLPLDRPDDALDPYAQRLAAFRSAHEKARLRGLVEVS